MRSILLLVLGLLVGALGAVKISTTLNLRDAYPRGVMSVMQHHLGSLGQEMRQGSCPATDSRLHLRRLAALQADIIPAFAQDIGAKPDFRKHARELDQAVNQGLRAAPVDCAALHKVVSDIGDTCKSCHQVYR